MARLSSSAVALMSSGLGVAPSCVGCAQSWLVMFVVVASWFLVSRFELFSCALVVS